MKNTKKSAKQLRQQIPTNTVLSDLNSWGKEEEEKKKKERWKERTKEGEIQIAVYMYMY